jgi:voltage-gated potassium channel
MLAVDLATVVVPLLGLLPGISERDQGFFCSIWILKLLRNSETFRLVVRVLANEARNLLGVMAMFGMVLFCAALAAHLLERDAQPGTFESIPRAMWWAVVTLTTTGYGDSIPQSFAGRVLAGVVMTCGIGVFALWAGILATGFSEEIRRHDFIRNWQLVSGVPLFQRLDPAELAEIVLALRPRNVPAGAVICRKDEPGDQMFFILEGRVSVAAATPVELGPGTFFGEIALVTGEPRSATVTASTAVALLSLHVSDFQILSGRIPELANAIRRTALDRRGTGPKS